MAGCDRVECQDGCLSFFRYYVNQQPAVFNDSITITPECPIGFDCQDADDIVIDPGEESIIPDLPPYDPDIDDRCGYECELDIYTRNTRDPWLGLAPRKLIKNEEQTVTCSDLGLDPTGTATEVVAEGTVVLSMQPGVDLESVKQAEANQLAFEIGKVRFLAAIALGTKFCTDPGTPSAIWTFGLMEKIGEYNFKYGDPVGRTVVATLGPCQLYVESNRDCEAIDLDPPFPAPAPIWYNHIPWSGMNSNLKSVSPITCLGSEFRYDIGAAGGSYVNGVSCATIVSTASGLAGINPLDRNSETLSVDKEVQLDMTGLSSVGTMNLEWFITGKPAIDHTTIGLTRTVTNWANVLAFPLGSSNWQTSGSPAFGGALIGREFFANTLQWTARACGGISPVSPNVSVAGKKLFYNYPGDTDNEIKIKWVDDLDPTDFGQPAGPNITGWILEVWFEKVSTSKGLAFAAFSLGALGTGQFISKPNATNHTLDLYKGEVRAATTIALPANTLAAGVLTASANGQIPAVDGVPLVNTNKIIVKNEGTPAKNGVYVVTDIGSAGTPWVLTRDASLNSDAELQICLGFIWTVTEGTTNVGNWYTSQEGTTIDTDPIAFTALPIVAINVT